MTLTFGPSYLLWVAALVTALNAFSLFFACVGQLKYEKGSVLWNYHESINFKKAERLTLQFFFFCGVVAQYIYARLSA